MPNLRGLALGWPFPFPGTVGAAVAVLSSVTLFLFAARWGWKASRTEKFDLQFSLAVVISVLTSWHTNVHDLCLLILPLVLTTNYCLRPLPRRPGRRFTPLFPVLPVLISPLWIVLWLVGGEVNLMAIPLLWWALKIGKELSCDLNSAGGLQPSASALTMPESGLP
jgi:hypothetical protein